MRALLLATALSLSAPVFAQPITTQELDDLFNSEPRVEVNLRGSLIRLAAEATRAEGPEAALMLDGIRSVVVRIYSSPVDQRLVDLERLSLVGDRFEDDGWSTIVRVRSLPDDPDNDGDVWVYVRDEGDVLDGLAVLALSTDDDTAVMVHIDGTIDPAQIGALSRRFARIDLEDDLDSDDDE
ncbi:DUF4252 domain-containing protein [Rubrivirga sp.]|uniref:DUF4252 domain-containing protein n=1 Tax=Rubrivirga sp. TaxID=1885344 RepID=UPI003C749731